MNCSYILPMYLCVILCHLVGMGFCRTSQRWCGPLLSDKLASLCRAGFHGPMVHKRHNSVQTVMWPEKLNLLKRMGSARVADECCLKPCSLRELRRYCVGSAPVVFEVDTDPKWFAQEESERNIDRGQSQGSNARQYRIGTLPTTANNGHFFVIPTNPPRN